MPPKRASKKTDISSDISTPKRKQGEKLDKAPEKIRNACVVINNWTDDDITRLNGLTFRYMIVGKEGKPCSRCASCKDCSLCKKCKKTLTAIYEEGFSKFEKAYDIKLSLIDTLPPCKDCYRDHCYSCPDKCLYKTLHLQCYIEFANSISFNSVKKQLPGAHIEYVLSSEKLRTYCKKEGDFKEYGIPKRQGAHHELDEIRQIARTEGMRGVSKIASAPQIRIAETYLSYNEEPRDWEPNVFWICGPTDSCKSRLARHILKTTPRVGDLSPEEDTFVLHPILTDDIPDPYTKNEKSKWWTGYDGHANVIIDDFRPAWWHLTYLLSLLDRYECRVELKGNVRQFRARNIIVTSIKSPEEMYNRAGKSRPLAPSVDDDSNSRPYDPQEIDEPCEQLLRRINEIIHLEYYIDPKTGKRDMDKCLFTNHKMNGRDHTLPRIVTKGVIDFNDPTSHNSPHLPYPEPNDTPKRSSHVRDLLGRAAGK